MMARRFGCITVWAIATWGVFQSIVVADDTALVLAPPQTDVPVVESPANHLNDSAIEVPQLVDVDSVIEAAPVFRVEPIVVETPSSVESDAVFEIEIGDVDLDCDEDCEPDGPIVTFNDWVGYNATSSNTTWLIGDEFGMFSTESYPSLDFGERNTISFGTGIHFVNGPETTVNEPADLPPRLFDLQVAHQSRTPFGRKSMLDLRLGLGVFSDFDGSARKGVRFPGHAVAYHQYNESWVGIFGAEFLDRDDISVLPVLGFVVQPHHNVMIEAVFPRPRIQLRMAEDEALTISGEIGGGTWAVERFGDIDDTVTYHDLRLLVGYTEFGMDADSAFEVGWAFDRSIRYRSGRGDRDFDGALIFRCHKHY